MVNRKTAQAQAVFQIVSQLLQYPDNTWEDELANFQQYIESLGDEAVAHPLEQFLHNVQRIGIDKLHELYVQTFDFGKKTNLYVTYARHGEQRERGPALLALKQYYAQFGFQMHDDELSDYLPLMLEFAAIAPLEAVHRLLNEHRPAIEDIRAHLDEIDSPYVELFDMLHLAMHSLDNHFDAEGGAAR